LLVAPISLWTRVTHWANVLIWRAPLSERLKSHLSVLVYRNPPMPAGRVVETLAALRSAGIEAWVMGGWGIDALVGTQSRTHRDLDLIVDHRDVESALAVLLALGYAEWNRYASPDPIGDFEAAGDNVVVRDEKLRVVDVHDVVVHPSGPRFASGTIAGLRVNCLTAEQQLRANQGYHKRLPHEQLRNRTNAQLARQLAERNNAA
jgi:lincosamide nucleotidyltransferase A/C/D/E